MRGWCGGPSSRRLAAFSGKYPATDGRVLAKVREVGGIVRFSLVVGRPVAKREPTVLQEQATVCPRLARPVDDGGEEPGSGDGAAGRCLGGSLAFSGKDPDTDGRFLTRVREAGAIVRFPLIVGRPVERQERTTLQEQAIAGERRPEPPRRPITHRRPRELGFRCSARGGDRRPDGGDDARPRRQLRPTISPFSSKSMIDAAGFVPRPGIVRMSPQMG